MAGDLLRCLMEFELKGWMSFLSQKVSEPGQGMADHVFCFSFFKAHSKCLLRQENRKERVGSARLSSLTSDGICFAFLVCGSYDSFQP